MNKGIRTYEELEEYRKQLQVLLYAQRQLIIYDIDEIKEHVRPLTEIAAKASKLFMPPENESMLTKFSSTVIDYLIRNVVMKKSGWIAKAVVPFLVHNFSSHLVANNEQGILKKILAWLSKGKKSDKEKN